MKFTQIILNECPFCGAQEPEHHCADCLLSTDDPGRALQVLKKDCEYWRDVATYLGSCNAASLDDGAALTSSRLKRYISLAEKSLAYLERRGVPPRLGWVTREKFFADTKDRLRRAIERVQFYRILKKLDMDRG